MTVRSDILVVVCYVTYIRPDVVGSNVSISVSISCDLHVAGQGDQLVWAKPSEGNLSFLPSNGELRK